MQCIAKLFYMPVYILIMILQGDILLVFTDERWNFLIFKLFILSRAVVPLIQGFEDAGDFTVSERLKTSVHVNLVFYLIVGSIGLFGIILLIMMHRSWLVLIFLAIFILLPVDDVSIMLASCRCFLEFLSLSSR